MTKEILQQRNATASRNVSDLIEQITSQEGWTEGEMTKILDNIGRFGKDLAEWFLSEITHAELDWQQAKSGECGDPWRPTCPDRSDETVTPEERMQCPRTPEERMECWLQSWGAKMLIFSIMAMEMEDIEGTIEWAEQLRESK